MFRLLALLVGEVLLLWGLHLAWSPLPFVVAGVQLAAFGLLSEESKR